MILPTDFDVIAIVLVESFGAIFFLLALIFVNDSQRVKHKMKAVQEDLSKTPATDRRHGSPCYSYKWAIKYAMESKKKMKHFMTNPFLAMWYGVIAFLIGFLVFFIVSTAGYILFISLIGALIFLDADAFEAHGYSKAIQKVPIDQLVEEDQSYMEIANGALQMATIRFLMVGATFAVVGPFITPIFNGLCYVLALYMEHTIFQAVESAWNVSQFLALFLALILPGILIYLPELAGRIIFTKAKAAIRARTIKKEQ